MGLGKYDGVMTPFSHSVIQSLGHLVTWSLGHSVIQSLGHLVTQTTQ